MRFTLDEGLDRNESMLIGIRKILRRMNEAPMSDEDKRDSDILRRVMNKNYRGQELTKEEKGVLDKYGLYFRHNGDWQLYKKTDDLYHHSLTNSNAHRGEEINLADRARKMSSRDEYHRWREPAYQGYSYDTTYSHDTDSDGNIYGNPNSRKPYRDSELDRRTINSRMSEPYRNLEKQLLYRKDSKKDLDDFSNGVDEYSKAIDDLKAKRANAMSNARTRYSNSQSEINKLLKRESYKRLSEGYDEFDFKSDVYNALAKVAYRASLKGFNANDRAFELAFDFFITHFADDEYAQDDFESNEVDEALESSDKDMKEFEVTYSLDGTKTQKKVKALNANQAQELIKKENDGKNVTFQGTKLVEDFEEPDEEIKSVEEDEVEDNFEYDDDVDNGIANVITGLIQSEFQQASDINDAIATFEAEGKDDYSSVLNDISNSTNNTIGELQGILQDVNPSAENISDGIENVQNKIEDAENPEYDGLVADDDTDGIELFVGEK